MYASNVPQLVIANLDIQRFTAVNTAKGAWPLLDLMRSTEMDAAATVTAAPAVESVKAAMGHTDIQRTVREVAAVIVGESLEG